ncbi:hypothetical protein B7486_23440 [cyanobacterium TDX16]|nr:hypothetical protein B7486_23440 [cyanobacterium TDX16]
MKNQAASVKQRLLNFNRSQAQPEEFQKLLQRYALERLLYRLSQSQHKDTYVLKGAMLFSVWMSQPHRSTQDLDLLGHGNNSIAAQTAAFEEICRIGVEDDGLVFLPQSIRGSVLQSGQKYEGVRIKLTAKLENAQIPLQIDIGFGQAVTPAEQLITYPTLLNFPTPSIKAYPRETVVAEKFQAMVELGTDNSRLKDFYDLWVLGQEFRFDGQTLKAALQATFERRNTRLPTTTPVGLSPQFSQEPEIQSEWRKFLRRNQLSAAGSSFSEITSFLEDFLMPPSMAAAENREFNRLWVGRDWSRVELVKLNDLVNWCSNAQVLGRDRDDIQKIDKILFSAREKTNDPTAIVEIGESEFRAMQRDGREFTQLGSQLIEQRRSQDRTSPQPQQSESSKEEKQQQSQSEQSQRQNPERRNDGGISR